LPDSVKSNKKQSAFWQGASVQWTKKTKVVIASLSGSQAVPPGDRKINGGMVAIEVLVAAKFNVWKIKEF
jgi:hypothetical protein